MFSPRCKSLSPSFQFVFSVNNRFFIWIGRYSLVPYPVCPVFHGSLHVLEIRFASLEAVVYSFCPQYISVMGRLYRFRIPCH